MDNPKQYQEHPLAIAILESIRHVFNAIPLNETLLSVEEVDGMPVIKRNNWKKASVTPENSMAFLSDRQLMGKHKGEEIISEVNNGQ